MNRSAAPPDIAGARRYNAEGISETPVDAVAVPKAAFDELMARSAEFRRFVFSDYSSRITDLLHVVEEVAFERIDKRLAQKLLDLADSEGRLSATHQEPAVELGSAREVVSRHLKEFQRRGWLELTRGLICLTDRANLRASPPGVEEPRRSAAAASCGGGRRPDVSVAGRAAPSCP